MLPDSKKNGTVVEFCKVHKIHKATFYNWRNKYDVQNEKPAAFIPVQFDQPSLGSALFAEIEIASNVTVRLYQRVDASWFKALPKKMIHISDKCRYLLYSGNTDMRKSFHGLAAIVKYKMQRDVLNGDIYIFISKRRNAIKLLRFESDGFAIFYKRLEKGTFEIPAYDSKSAAMMILSTASWLCSSK